jgi:hypothetical protein
MLLPSAPAVWHHIPRHPRPYGLLPDMSESSGTPGADSVRGFPGFPVG